MRFVEVKEVPLSNRRTAPHGSLADKIRQFIDMDIPFARVEYEKGEYTSLAGCLTSMQNVCVKNGFPACAIMRNGDIYIVRMDITDAKTREKIFGGNANA